nr:MAG TPA: hypothetical protein [Caudoviricetes sp.]
MPSFIILRIHRHIYSSQIKTFIMLISLLLES